LVFNRRQNRRAIVVVEVLEAVLKAVEEVEEVEEVEAVASGVARPKFLESIYTKYGYLS
jgi:hypothetical protein